MLDSIADSMEYDAQQAEQAHDDHSGADVIVLMAFVVALHIAVMSPIIGSYSAIESSGNA